MHSKTHVPVILFSGRASLGSNGRIYSTRETEKVGQKGGDEKK